MTRAARMAPSEWEDIWVTASVTPGAGLPHESTLQIMARSPYVVQILLHVPTWTCLQRPEVNTRALPQLSLVYLTFSDWSLTESGAH